MKKISMEETKTLEYELLKYAKGICDKNNIKYYLAYGTLLGAVRHGGFIPWDDDVDIVLFREDYNRFLEAVQKDAHEYIKVTYMDNTDSFFGPYAMLIDTRTTIRHPFLKDELLKEYGICIDVFPLDVSSDLEEVKSLLKKSNFMKSMNNLTMIKNFSHEKGKKKIVKQIIAPFANLVGHRKWCQKIHALSKKTNTENPQYAMDLMWGPTMNWVVPFEAYKESVQLKFEDDYFNAPAAYDLVLRTGYGNYMEFPPEDQRGTGHFYDYYWK